jgi:D-3-phosphoglycerate dehydrogenase
MARKTVFVLDPYHKDAIALLQSTPDLDLVLPDNPRRSNWHAEADGVIVRSETRLSAADFEAASRLQVVVKQGVGVDNIDLEAAKSAGIAVHNTPALNSEAVAELSLALALSLGRRVTDIDRRIRKGERVVRSQVLGLGLFHKTVGIIGMGNIGREAAKKWTGACQANIIGYDPIAPEDAWQDIPHRRVEDLKDLMRESDVVTLHVPLLPTTRGMIGAAELKLMKDHAILINTARGGLVDENALLETLKQRRIWGAVLDAMETEPPTLDTYSELLELDNVILTPHIGASTIENQSNSGIAVVKILLSVLSNEKGVAGKVV